MFHRNGFFFAIVSIVFILLLQNWGQDSREADENENDCGCGAPAPLPCDPAPMPPRGCGCRR